MKFGSSRVLGKLSISALLAVGLLGQACGGDDEPSGDGDDTANSGGVDGAGATSSGGTDGTGAMGTGATGTGATGTGATGTGATGTGATGSTGTAVDTYIAPGDVSIAMNGFGTDSDNGFTGYFFTGVDAAGSVINPATFEALSAAEVAEGKVCANGTVAQVVNEEYGTYWGAQIGWNINQTEEGMEMPVDVSGVDGVTFTLVQAAPVGMRLQVSIDGDVYCKSITAGENIVAWSDLTKDCWTAGGTPFDPSTQEITNLIWSIPTSTAAPIDFDICVGGISFGTDGGGGMGGAGMGGMGGSDLGWDFTDAADVADFSVKPIGSCGGATECMEDVVISHGSGAMNLTSSFGSASNSGSIKSYVDHDFGEGSEVDLTGKTVTLNISWVSGGWGLTDSTVAGFDAYLVLQNGGDDGWTDVNKYLDLTTTPGGNLSVSLDLTTEAGGLNPAAVRLISVRVDSKYWGSGDPVFDYAPAMFAVDSIVIE